MGDEVQSSDEVLFIRWCSVYKVDGGSVYNVDGGEVGVYNECAQMANAMLNISQVPAGKGSGSGHPEVDLVSYPGMPFRVRRHVRCPVPRQEVLFCSVL